MRLEYFEIIDRIVDLQLAERTIRCEADFPAKSTIFDGHFPTYPLVPGVLLAEAMAQTAGWLIVAVENFERMPFLAALRDTKFRTFVTPGQRLSLSARLVNHSSGFALAEAKGEVNGKIVCDGMLTFLIGDYPTPHLRQHSHDFATKIGFPFAALAK